MQRVSTASMLGSVPVVRASEVTPRSANATGDDQAEEVEIGRDVEGKPVAGHPSRNAHADRADLGVPDPRSAQPCDPSRREAVVGADADHHLFEIAHVTVHVATIGIEIDDRIADELPWPVVGHIAAAAGLEHLDAERGQPFRCRHDIAATVLLHADGDDVRVLQKKEGVWNAPGLAVVNQGALQLERVRVRDEAKPTDVERRHSPSNSSIPFFTSAMN